MAGEKKSRQTDTAKAAPSRRSTQHARRGRFNMDSEQTARFLIIGSVVGIVLIALGFVAFGWYWTELRPEGRTVLQVDEQKVSYRAMKRRMGYELVQNATLQQSAGALPAFSYNALLDELTIVSRADEQGVLVDQAKFDEALRNRIGVAPDADQRTFQDRLRTQLDFTGLNESEYRRLILADVTETALKDKFEAELPATIPQARVEVVNAESQEQAEAAITRINAGEPFADVAKELSIDPTAQDTGGLSEFGIKSGFPDPIQEYVFSAPVGQLSGPLGQEVGENRYVVRVVERTDRPLEEDQKPTLAQEKYDEWLRTTKDEMLASGATKNKFDEEDQAEALTDMSGRIRDLQNQAIEDQIAQLTVTAQLTQNPAPTAPPVVATPAPPGAESTPAASPQADSGGGVTPPSQPVAPSTP
jgi:parvulin-like peptidyl-prolyl isomerase